MIKWSARKYTKEEFIDAWNSSLSVAEIARKLGYNPGGGGYLVINSTAEELQLNKNHMTGSAWNVGSNFKPFGKKMPLSEALVENSPYQNTGHLKQRLLTEGVLKNECYECGQGPSWNDTLLTLQLDHINGNRKDNRVENLRILCPNCHSQTDTWGRKTRGDSTTI